MAFDRHVDCDGVGEWDAHGHCPRNGLDRGDVGCTHQSAADHGGGRDADVDHRHHRHTNPPAGASGARHREWPRSVGSCAGKRSGSVGEFIARRRHRGQPRHGARHRARYVDADGVGRHHFGAAHHHRDGTAGASYYGSRIERRHARRLGGALQPHDRGGGHRWLELQGQRQHADLRVSGRYCDSGRRILRRRGSGLRFRTGRGGRSTAVHPVRRLGGQLCMDRARRHDVRSMPDANGCVRHDGGVHQGCRERLPRAGGRE